MNVSKQPQQKVEQQLCKSCNKFWGTEANQGYCSKCFGLNNKVEPKLVQKISMQTKKSLTQPDTQRRQQIKPQQNKSKCYACFKKVGLLGIQCKCGHVYCNTHRLPQQHSCSINYQQQGKQKLKKQFVVMPKRKLTQL